MCSSDLGTLGAGAAALVVTLAGQALFLGAAALLVSRLASGNARWWSLVLLASVSGYYGGVGVFRIAETFATARVLAEPLVIGALAARLGLTRRWRFSESRCRHRSATSAGPPRALEGRASRRWWAP